MAMTNEEIRKAARRYWGKLKRTEEIQMEANGIRAELENEGVDVANCAPGQMVKRTVVEVGSE